MPKIPNINNCKSLVTLKGEDTKQSCSLWEICLFAHVATLALRVWLDLISTFQITAISPFEPIRTLVSSL